VLSVLTGERPSLDRRYMRSNLLAGIQLPCVDKSCVFDSISPLVTLPPKLVQRALSAEGSKTMIDPEILFRNLSTPCIVYGIGIATDSTFEQTMSGYCEVHAFDCTITSQSPSVFNKAFKFHPICIGPKADLSATLYGVGQDPKAMTFQTLEETMTSLGHQKLDVLKFDIEGSEWSLFEVIWSVPSHLLPIQMFFEVHTEGTTPSAVHPSLVQGKGRSAVNAVFIRLLDMGYSVFSKIINGVEPAAAEFSIVKLPT